MKKWNWTAIFEWCVVGCGFQEQTQKDIVVCLKEIGLRAGNLVNRSRLHSGHRKWGDVYDSLMSSRIGNMIINKIFTWALKIMRQMATCTIWNWQSSCTKCDVFRILWEVGAEMKMSIEGLLTLRMSNFVTNFSSVMSLGICAFLFFCVFLLWMQLKFLNDHSHSCLQILV